MSPDSPQPSARPPHPLAVRLIDRLRTRPGAAVLEVGRGSGRNTRALEAAGFTVVALDDEPIAAGALSTHAFLHGTPASIAQLLDAVAAHVEAGAPFFVTFGSVHDARFGRGTQIEPNVYAPQDGDEAGVAHAFFDERGLRALFEPDWYVESMREERVDDVAGGWAHERAPLRDAVHWFVVARRR